ncbi:TPA: hypothetical protein DF272_04250 [Candidatus Falkowbacteria bacterium]|nr:hypothetical protein [Candidatus Falkowbacteria bacterium]
MSKKKSPQNHQSDSHPRLNDIHEIFHSNQPETTKSTTKIDDTNIIADIIREEREKRKWRLIIFASVFLSLCAIAALSGFLFFTAYNPFAEEKILLSIDGPDKIKVGEETIYNINYQNSGNIPINNTKLILTEPHGFNLIASTPEISGHSFDLGTLEPNERGSVEIIGDFIDNLEVPQVLSATIIFIPNNFNSEFSVTAEFNTALEPLPVTIQINAPPTTIAAQDTSIEITLTNDGLKPYKNFRLFLDHPETFTINQSDHDYYSENQTIYWDVDLLNPDQTINFKLTGRFASNFDYFTDQNQEQPFTVATALVGANDDNYRQTQEPFSITLTEEPITVSLVANGHSDTGAINFNDKLNLNLTFMNKSSDTINDLVLELSVSAKPLDILDWKKLENDNFAQLEKTDTGTNLTWRFNNVELLESLQPGKKASLDIGLPILPLDQINYTEISALENITITASAVLYYNENSTPVKSNSVALNVNSNLRLDVSAKYYNAEGTAIGQGPLPPLAGETTSYFVTLTLTNALHELNNLSIQSTLPPKVFWAEDFTVSAGEVKYTPIDRIVTWTINRLPVSAESASITFKVDLKPSANDVGKLLKLLEYTNIRATDTVTNDTITQTYGIITTNLESDQFGIGKGIVQSGFDPQ